jgi:hypothetical protein
MLPEAPYQESPHKQPTRQGSPAREPGEAPVWLQRSALVLLVVLCIYIGLALIALPWTNFWTENHFFSMLPERWANWLKQGGVRGVVSGIGLLDIWIGLSEAVHWRSRR